MCEFVQYKSGERGGDKRQGLNVLQNFMAFIGGISEYRYVINTISLILNLYLLFTATVILHSRRMRSIDLEDESAEKNNFSYQGHA